MSPDPSCVDKQVPHAYTHNTCELQLSHTENCAKRRSGELDDGYCRKTCGLCDACLKLGCDGAIEGYVPGRRAVRRVLRRRRLVQAVVQCGVAGALRALSVPRLRLRAVHGSGPAPPPAPIREGAHGVLDRINARFNNAKATNDLAGAGVIIHQWDGWEGSSDQPWMPCPASCEHDRDTCANPARCSMRDRMSCSIIGPLGSVHIFLNAGNQQSGPKSPRAS